MSTRYLRGLGDTNILIFLERLAADQPAVQSLPSARSAWLNSRRECIRPEKPSSAPAGPCAFSG